MSLMPNPKLSIGLPVFNAETYLRSTLKVLLTQTFQDFELIISDNASTDSTAEICAEYQEEDRRIRYSRNPENLGAARNFNQVFSLARGEYFKWATYDDSMANDFLSKCVAVLDQDPGIILAFSREQRIDPEGNILQTRHHEMRIDDPRPHIRFRDLIFVRHSCVAIGGVIRREILRKTPLIGSYVGSDRNLLAELGLLGRFFEIPEVLFYRRDHPENTFRKYSRNELQKWFDPQSSKRFHLTYWKNGIEYLRSVNRAQLIWKERCTLQNCCLLVSLLSQFANRRPKNYRRATALIPKWLNK
jgi:glycosyltransferase involved in cell wall biosynthesis